MPKSIEVQTYNMRQVQDAMKVTGKLIAAARKERKWSQSELGKRLGDVDRRHISALENGGSGADFGLVVSALWILNLPLLSTLPLGGQASSGDLNAIINAVVKLSARPESRASATGNKAAHGAGVKKVIDNDF